MEQQQQQLNANVLISQNFRKGRKQESKVRLNQSIDIRAVSLDLGSYGNRSTRFRDFVVGICESREY